MNSRYKVKIIGKDPKRFVKEIITKKISIYQVENLDSDPIIIVDEEGLAKLKEIKTSYKIKVIREYGLIRIKHLIKKYSYFLMALLVGSLLLLLLSNMIFTVEVQHSKSEIRNLIKQDLKLYGISKYKFRVSYNKKEEIKKKILAKETDKIEWLEIERIGTKYLVKVEERIKNEVKTDNKAQNIIAKKNAMILRISATSGEVVKKKFDYVQKGDVLISGFITKDEKIVSKTKAIGSVFGEVWYQVQVDLPKAYKVVNKTGKSKKRLELTIFDKNIFLFDFNKYKTYQVEKKELLRNNILPVSLNYATIYETNEISKNYDITNVSNEAIKLASNKLKQKLGPKDKIISKKVLKKTERDSRIIVDVFFKVEEDITEEESIENIKIEDIEGEKSGTSN